MIRAILSHGDHTGVARQSRLEHTLFACDELSGFIMAAALVRPSKSVLDLEVSSVKKRMKDKAFARAIPREDLQRGADELGLPLDEHIGHVIAALREAAGPLGPEGDAVTGVSGSEPPPREPRISQQPPMSVATDQPPVLTAPDASAAGSSPVDRLQPR